MNRRQFLTGSSISLAAVLMGINGCVDEKDDSTLS